MTFIVFDLDDTLYLERDFVLSGYRAVGIYAREKLGIDTLEKASLSAFANGERRWVFDKALLSLGVKPRPALVQDLVKVYRGHAPQITLQPDANRALRRFSGQCGLISDGPAETQTAKVAALDLQDRLSHIVLTGSLGPGAGKPARRAFDILQEATGLRGDDLVYVADNPIKDFITPRRMGWQTVMIARPHRLHRSPAPTPDHAAAHRIVSLDLLDDCLTRPLRGAEVSAATDSA